MNVGDKIKEIRNLKGYSQKELAEKSGLSKTSIYNYEKGLRSPKECDLNKIATVLGVSTESLISQSEIFDMGIDTIKLSKEVQVLENIEECFSKSHVQLLEYYDSLNALGKKVALERLSELVQLDKYIKEGE